MAKSTKKGKTHGKGKQRESKNDASHGGGSRGRSNEETKQRSKRSRETNAQEDDSERPSRKRKKTSKGSVKRSVKEDAATAPHAKHARLSIHLSIDLSPLLSSGRAGQRNKSRRLKDKRRSTLASTSQSERNAPSPAPIAARGVAESGVLGASTSQSERHSPSPAPIAAGVATESGVRNQELEDKIQKLSEDTKTGRTGSSGLGHVTFRIHRPRSGSVASEDDKGYVFFHSPLPDLSGPFAFLSNFWKSEFQVEEVAEGFTFTSMEQYYLYCKTKCFKAAEELIVDYPRGKKISSYEITHLVRKIQAPGSIARAVRDFVKLGQEQNPRWYSEWSQVWSMAIPEVLDEGLKAKFRDNAELRKSLMLTGDFVLAEASASDAHFGIGISAQTAFEKRDEWESDATRNLLGKALMKCRQRILAEDDKAWSPSFDYAHYNGLELEFWQKRVGIERRKEMLRRFGILPPAQGASSAQQPPPTWLQLTEDPRRLA